MSELGHSQLVSDSVHAREGELATWLEELAAVLSQLDALEADEDEVPVLIEESDAAPARRPVTPSVRGSGPVDSDTAQLVELLVGPAMAEVRSSSSDFPLPFFAGADVERRSLERCPDSLTAFSTNKIQRPHPFDLFSQCARAPRTQVERVRGALRKEAERLRAQLSAVDDRYFPAPTFLGIILCCCDRCL